MWLFPTRTNALAGSTGTGTCCSTQLLPEHSQTQNRPSPEHKMKQPKIIVPPERKLNNKKQDNIPHPYRKTQQQKTNLHNSIISKHKPSVESHISSTKHQNNLK
jgi:hypothetical protein